MTADISNHPLKGVSDLEKDAFIGLRQATEQLEELEVAMKDKLATIERPEVYIVMKFATGDVEVQPIEPAYLDVNVGEVLSSYLEKRSEYRVSAYLRMKYADSDGLVPLSSVRDELGVDIKTFSDRQLNNWVGTVHPEQFLDKKMSVAKDGRLELRLTDSEKRKVFVQPSEVAGLMSLLGVL